MNDLVSQAAILLQKNFGSDWEKIAQILGTENLRNRLGKSLTSFVAYPDRGNGGNNLWRGNCSPQIIEQITKYVLECKKYYRKNCENFTLIDPMSGSGTSKAVADKLGIRSILYDLNPEAPAGQGGFDVLTQDVDDSGDLIFLHPPYWDIIEYSGNVWGKQPHQSDLSRCKTYDEFMQKLNYIIKKLFLSLRKDGRLAILVGDIRQKGKFYNMVTDIEKIGDSESFIVKAQLNCTSDKRQYNGKPFIPSVLEHMIVLHKQNSLIFTVTKHITCEVDLSKQNANPLTWHHLIRLTMEAMGGTATLNELYQKLSSHPKSIKNKHYKERIRATIYEHKNQYISIGTGEYQLDYEVN